MEAALEPKHIKAAIGQAGSPIDPLSFGLTKAAYTVNATLDLLSIGRTSLYAAVKQGDLHPVKFGRKTLFYAADLAAFLAHLRNRSDETVTAAKKDGCR